MTTDVIYSAATASTRATSPISWGTNVAQAAGSYPLTLQVYTSVDNITPLYITIEGQLDFDTSSIPAFANIASATLELDVSSIASTFTTRAKPVTTIGTTNSHLSRTESLAITTAATWDSTGYSGAGYYAMTESGTGLVDSIVKGGSTQFILVSQYQEAGAPSAGIQHVTLVNGDGATVGAKLSVTYSTGEGGFMGFVA